MGAKILVGVFIALQLGAYFTLLSFLGSWIAHAHNVIYYVLGLVAFSIAFMTGILHIGILLLFSNPDKLR